MPPQYMMTKTITAHDSRVSDSAIALPLQSVQFFCVGPLDDATANTAHGLHGHRHLSQAPAKLL